MTLHRIGLIAALIVSAVFAGPAMALDATPFAGAMIPTNSLVLLTDGSAFIRMQSHTVYGVALSSAFTPRLGLEAVLGIGTGKLELVGGGTNLLMGSTMYMADLRGNVRIAGGEGSRMGLLLGAGYTDVETGIFDLAHETGQGTFLGRLTGVAGLGMRGRLSDRLLARVEVVDRIHLQGAKLENTTSTSEKTQNDIVATLGLTIVLH